jgi:hypothetical protein
MRIRDGGSQSCGAHHATCPSEGSRCHRMSCLLHYRTKKTHEILWGPKTALLGKSPLAVSARRSSTSQVTARGDPPGNAWAPHVRHTAASTSLLSGSIYSAEIFLSEISHIYGEAASRSRVQLLRPIGGSNRHYSEHKTTEDASGPIFCTHSSNGFGAVRMHFYGVDSGFGLD